MEKVSIFKQIDNLYTKAVEVIIAEDSEERANPEASVKKTSTSVPTPKMETLKKTVTNVKNTLLSIGTPNEKEILYKEVVKRERQEDKETAKITRKKSQALKAESKTNTTPSQKTAIQTTTSTNKSTTTKKPTKLTPTKKSTGAPATKSVIKKTTVPKTETTKKATPKKTAEKKTATISKSPSTKTTKKVEPKKTTSAMKPTVSKAKAVPRGAKKAAKIALYIKDIKKHYGEVDEEFVTIIVNNLGPSIYKKNAELVSCSDPKELDTVRKSFLIKKLGIDASKGVLDAAIQDVCAELKATRTKYRATFYYALAKKFKKESVLN